MSLKDICMKASISNASASYFYSVNIFLYLKGEITVLIHQVWGLGRSKDSRAAARPIER